MTPEQRECTNPLHEAPDGSLVCPVCGLLIEKTSKKRLVAIVDEWEADPRPAKKRTRN